MKSIGDFALNIIPNIDTIKLNTGITALDSLSNIAGKVWDVFKGAYGVIDNTAEKLRDINYVAKELKLPVDQVLLMSRAMTMYGENADQAFGIMKAMGKFKAGARYGEYDTGLIMKAGLTPESFGNDPVKNIEMMIKKYQGADINARSAIVGLLGPGSERMLAGGLPQFQKTITDLMKTMPDKAAWEASEKYKQETAKMSIALDNLAIALTGAGLPGLTKAIIRISEILESSKVKKIINKTGTAMSLTGEAFSELSEGNIKGGVKLGNAFISNIPRFAAAKALMDFGYDIILKGFTSGSAKEAAENAKIYLNINNHSDGSHIETTVKQVNADTSKRVIQTNPGGKQ